MLPPGRMKNPIPRSPAGLDPLAREVLNLLRGRPEAADIVIGGGVALQHYVEFRPTLDLDAWWSSDARDRQGASALLHEVMAEIANSHSFRLSVRRFGETDSYELGDERGKVFSVQIAIRSVELDAPLESEWSPVKIETLRENLAAKMNALVARGAPRDYVDIYTVCTRGIASPGDCWDLWKAKNSDADVHQAATAILTKLRDIEARRPLERIADVTERGEAERIRWWFATEFPKPVRL